MVTLPEKDPNDVVDYAINVLGLNIDTLASVTVSTPVGGLTILSAPAPSVSGTIARFWASGGRLKFSEPVTLTLVTNGGRTFRRTLVVPIRSL